MTTQLTSLSQTSLMSLITVASICLAVLMTVIAFRTLSLGRGSPAWRGKAAALDRRLSHVESLLGAYPGLALVWDKTAKGEVAMRTYGSAAALASLRRFADSKIKASTGEQILGGLNRFEVVGASAGAKLVDSVEQLRAKGRPFSVALMLPNGGTIDATGRVAGRQAVVWIDDPNLRGEADESESIRRLDANRATALRDPQAYIDMVDRLSTPAWRADASGRIMWANPAYVRAVDKPSLSDVIRSQEQLDGDMIDQMQRVIATGKRSVDTRPVVVRGKRRALQIMLYPVTGGVAGLAVDATEADNLRNALVTHIRAHDKTLDALGEGVVIFGPDRVMRFHNRAFSDMFHLDESWYAQGPSHAAWLDKMREERLLPEQADFAQWKKDELSLYTDWPDEVPEALWHLPDTRMLRVVKQRDPEGGLLLLFTDLTDQLTLKSQLGTQINVQKATLDRLSEGIAVFGTDGRLRLFNRAFANMWNLSATALEQSPLFGDLLPELARLHGDRDYWEELIASVTDPNPDVRRMREGDITRNDQSFMTWLSRPLPDGATLVAFEDRTQEKRAEDALVQRAEALEDANRIKSEFVGHISYQLRNPLTTISGFAELLQSEIKGELNDEQSGYVFAVQSAADELTKTIDDILDIAAIEANVLNLELGDVDVHDMIDTTVDYLATRAEDTKIQIKVNCPRDIGMIRADGARLRQVIYNLMLNALRHTKPGGQIDVGAERMSGGITIWVKDTGEGIPLEHQPQVFDSFQSSRGGGTGMGLALVNKLVERHGGWVDLASEPGKGTHVTCYLPSEATADSAHPELDLLAGE